MVETRSGEETLRLPDDFAHRPDPRCASFTGDRRRNDPFSLWGGNAVSVTVLVALLVCRNPTAPSRRATLRHWRNRNEPNVGRERHRHQRPRRRSRGRCRLCWIKPALSRSATAWAKCDLYPRGVDERSG